MLTYLSFFTSVMFLICKMTMTQLHCLRVLLWFWVVRQVGISRRLLFYSKNNGGTQSSAYILLLNIIGSLAKAKEK